MISTKTRLGWDTGIIFQKQHRIGVVNVWSPYPCHVVAPAILQSLIVPLRSPRGCCVALAVWECNTAKCSFSAVCPPWETFDQLRCCFCFRVSLLTCSAPWLSGVLSELKPDFLQIVLSRIRRRVHDNLIQRGTIFRSKLHSNRPTLWRGHNSSHPLIR